MTSGVVRESPSPGPLPLYQLLEWNTRYGVSAGITGRGAEPGRGFDLGLWSAAPVGEIMSHWAAFRRTMGEFDAVVLGNQVHGARVEHTGPCRGWVQVDGVDGWVATSAGVLLTVTVADCIPVYLVAPGRGIALLHAGWRGLAGGILGRGVECLARLTGVPPTEIAMHCGVGICGSCYEVGSEVMLGCGLAADGAGPWHLDLRQRLVALAGQAGLREISTSAWCSAHDGPAFFSHRASRGADGRMVAWLGVPRAH